jgi:peptidyl-tRNA hydrolase
VTDSSTRPAGVDVRDTAPQYVLPLVVRLERADPPGRADALEAAARAVLALLADPRTTSPDGPWYDAVEAWTDGRIRKVVRRARGAEWRRAAELDGLTVTHRTATVRVYPPVPLDGWPRELSKLQVSGTELDDPGPLPAPAAALPVLWFNPALAMTAGKAMAQAGHAAQLTWWALSDRARTTWANAGFPLAVRTATRERWEALSRDGNLPVVHDAGFTEVPAGSATVIATHPLLDKE